METCNTFILILSGCKMADRRQNCRNVWLKHLLPDMRYKFVVGEGILEDSSYNDVVYLHNTRDDYQAGALKIDKMLHWISSNYRFDWLVIVDDDTYLVPERLKYVYDDNYDLIGYIPTVFQGGKLVQQLRCLYGGFGIILSQEIVQKLISKSDILEPSAKAKFGDGWLLRSVYKLNGQIKPDREFLNGYELTYPTKENRFISAHRIVTMGEMQAIDRLLRQSDSIVSSILVTHPQWVDNQGMITCFNDNTFYLIGRQTVNTSVGMVKKLYIDTGNYYYDNDSCCIVLNWDRWSPESITSLDNTRSLNSLYPVRYTHNTKGFNKIVQHLTNKK